MTPAAVFGSRVSYRLAVFRTALMPSVPKPCVTSAAA
jgi:hypothetical protein